MHSHLWFLSGLSQARADGVDELVLDFRDCTRAYPDGVVPLICSVEAARLNGARFRLILPADEMLKGIFVRSNWAYFLDPGSHDYHDRADSGAHLPLHRFETSAEQQAIVDAVLDVVMRNMRLERDVIAGLEWSLNEITDNVLNHSLSPSGGLVQVVTFGDSGEIAFVVSDSGRGIPASMREGHPALTSDTSALGEAIKQGVTRSPDVGQGNGLAGTVRIAALSNGQVSISSGGAGLEVFPDASTGAYTTKIFTRRDDQSFSGCSVYARLNTRTSFNLGDALAFSGAEYRPSDIIELSYTDDRDNLIFHMGQETVGFGTRAAGKEIRTKLINLLDAEPNKRLVIDWSGVPLVSSSFADEAVGRLFVLLGPMAFAARVQHVYMEEIVRRLVDQGILQRAAQAIAGE